MSLLHVIKNQWNRFFPSKQARVFGRWKKDNCERLRYEYPLDENSVVFDVGGYEGSWAEEIFKRYGSTLHVFEPVKEYATALKKKFDYNKKIVVHDCGLSDKNISTEIMLDDNKSSLYITASKREKIKLTSAFDFIESNNIEEIDLMKINIEGGEYDLLEHIIKSGLIQRVKNIQVQFHNFVPNARKRMEEIENELSKTHHTTYHYEFVWENWERNTQ